MKIKITRNIMHGGQPLTAGKVVDLPENEAQNLLNLHRAERVDKEKVAPEEVQAADPEVETRDPKGKPHPIVHTTKHGHRT